jgi:hypothetical protein
LSFSIFPDAGIFGLLLLIKNVFTPFWTSAKRDHHKEIQIPADVDQAEQIIEDALLFIVFALGIRLFVREPG